MAQHKIQSRIERVLGDSKPGNGILKIAGWALVIIIAVPFVYSAAALQVASQTTTQQIPAPSPVATQFASLQTAPPQPRPQSAPAVEAPAKQPSQSPDVEARELLDSVKYKVQQNYFEVQQKLAQAELSKALAAQNVPNRADLDSTADFMKMELMKLRDQMKVLEAQRDAEKSNLSQSTLTQESAMAAQNRLSMLDAQQRELGRMRAEIEAAAARQSEFERQKRTVSADEYQIRSGDIISVFVFSHSELSKERVLVQPDGRISIPLVQSLPAAGLTSTELKAAIESRLKESIYYPNVTVMLESTNVERR